MLNIQDIAVYKCQKNLDWWLIAAIIIFIILAVILSKIIGYEPAKVIL